MSPRTPTLVVQAAKRLGPLVLAVLVATGCSQKSYPVSLSFTLAEGTPLTAGFVTVQHTGDSAILGGGAIAADGTCRPLLRGRSVPGLPPGTYRLAVTAAATAGFDAPPPPLPFSPNYTNPAGSGLSFSVGPGNPDHHTFSLTQPFTSPPVP
jgi:predicted outer membrane repeat protein